MIFTLYARVILDYQSLWFQLTWFLHSFTYLTFHFANHPFSPHCWSCWSVQPTPVILLKEGTDTSQGIPQLVSNINACQVRGKAFFPLLYVSLNVALNSLCFFPQVIAEAVRTTLGPRGMDKLMVDGRGEERLWVKCESEEIFPPRPKICHCTFQVRPQSPTMEPPSWSCWMWFTLQPRPWWTSLALRMLRWEGCDVCPRRLN